MAYFPTRLQEPERIPELQDELGKQGVGELQREGLTVWAGFDEIDQPDILRIASEPSVRNYDWLDETDERFGSPEAVGRWVAHVDQELEVAGRAMFLLINHYAADETARLAGYGMAWPQRAKPPADAEPEHADMFRKWVSGETAVAVRVSERYRNKNVIMGFTKVVLAASNLMYGARNFWLEVWDSDSMLDNALTKARCDRKKVQIPGRRRLGYDGPETDDLGLYFTFSNGRLGQREMEGPHLELTQRV